MFLELKGQGKTLQGYLVKGAISRDGSFEFPEVVKSTVTINKYTYNFNYNDQVFITNELYGIYAVAQGGVVQGFYWDFLDDMEWQYYLEKYNSLEEFLENHYVKDQGIFRWSFNDQEAGFFIQGSIKEGVLERPFIQECQVFSSEVLLKFVLSDKEIYTMDYTGIIIDDEIKFYWDFLWMDLYENFSKLDKDYLQEVISRYSNVKI
jgi:hypothetical protein